MKNVAWFFLLFTTMIFAKPEQAVVRVFHYTENLFKPFSEGALAALKINTTNFLELITIFLLINRAGRDSRSFMYVAYMLMANNWYKEICYYTSDRAVQEHFNSLSLYEKIAYLIANFLVASCWKIQVYTPARNLIERIVLPGMAPALSLVSVILVESFLAFGK